MLQRNNKGQFVQTTKTQKYKQIKVKGKYVSVHNQVMCASLGVPKIPSGMVVHHIDKKGLNNDVNNLALMTITAHNRIHSHQAWNKGITTKDNKEWAEAHKKAQENRLKTFLPKFEETYRLKKEGKKLREISEIQNITQRNVSDRLRRYKELTNNF